MSDMYIKGLIVKKNKNLTTKDVTFEMIKLARERLILRRKIRGVK